MLTLAAGDYTLVLAPTRGGSILRFDWRGRPILRPATGDTILDVASFPLVPFCNRIAHGCFYFQGRRIVLEPNYPAADQRYPLHGFGWLSSWSVHALSSTTALLRHDWPGGAWPWPYRAWQRFNLRPDGLQIELSVRNLAADAMPVGLGFHPYFPIDAGTIYHGLHRGEWQTDAECLPTHLVMHPQPVDWWHGQALATRPVDTVYSNRHGPLTLFAHDRGVRIALLPAPALRHTVIYVPKGTGFACIEPVSQRTDQCNASPDDTDHRLLSPGESFAVRMVIRASSLFVRL